MFNSLSEDLGGWRERIWPGAFDGTLQDAGVYALWNHLPEYIIAAVADNTLRLSQDGVGLSCEMDPMDTQTIRDLVVTPIQQGKVRKMSFAFDVGTADWSVQDGIDVREIRSVSRLYDVSPVTYPAYPGTDISSRAMEAIVRRMPRDKVLSLLRADMPMTQSDCEDQDGTWDNGMCYMAEASRRTQQDCEAQGGMWDADEGMCLMPMMSRRTSPKIIAPPLPVKADGEGERTLVAAGADIEVYRRRAGLRNRLEFDYLERKHT